jgi:hypothetical protein
VSQPGTHDVNEGHTWEFVSATIDPESGDLIALVIRCAVCDLEDEK